ncbi:MAG: HPr kinase/phosphatase C-terminal domain-containing protein [Paracoccaceae bacterium]|nr:HPr kinase/phosphatase C-terminal domain-containing protein [Paracoccaceae bacterium]MDP7185626.1 HPr kinase/phosphatase C-terminal domain-containing protein [Paracoccaceae bacterium]
MDRSLPAEPPFHATCVCVADNGLLIIGPSGSGKSSLALEMMAFGAVLVADDRCVLTVHDDALYASSPETIAGRIEARGIGILNAIHSPQTWICAALDLGICETERLPVPRTRRIMGIDLPYYHKPDTIHLAAAMMQLLKAGRYA